jgi:hypothetical protein
MGGLIFVLAGVVRLLVVLFWWPFVLCLLWYKTAYLLAAAFLLVAG